MSNLQDISTTIIVEENYWVLVFFVSLGPSPELSLLADLLNLIGLSPFSLKESSMWRKFRTAAVSLFRILGFPTAKQLWFLHLTKLISFAYSPYLNSRYRSKPLHITVGEFFL